MDAVPGLGETRRTALLKHFGSVKKLRAATVEQICEVPGIGRRTAETVVAALSSRTPTTFAVNTATGEIMEEAVQQSTASTASTESGEPK
ncbi:helix-hairpin-helix domain-containing protein [Kitasatospora azatica]|uniref:helix-hairpin-helix domain-containing protein n=1 Tax=Kitasatospora azatica TaxID=58347 RepID=UPI0038996AF2